MIGTPFSLAASSAGSRPSDFSGEMIRASTPWESIDWMSEISLLRSPCALVTIRFVMPRFAASSRIDCVSAVRNGLASFSDCAKPIFALFRSSTPATPSPAYFSNVQRSPDSDSTFCDESAPPAGALVIGLPARRRTPGRDQRGPLPRYVRRTCEPLLFPSFSAGGPPRRARRPDGYCATTAASSASGASYSTTNFDRSSNAIDHAGSRHHTAVQASDVKARSDNIVRTRAVAPLLCVQPLGGCGPSC